VFGVSPGAAQSTEDRASAQSEPRSKAAVVSAATPHLTVRATPSATEVTPGARISIAVDITPKPGMHVYAPGGNYPAVAVRMEPQPFVRAHDVEYPQAQMYFYQPLNEHALVYSEAFRLVMDLTVGETSDPKARGSAPSRLTLKGALEYQACDDQVCYLPTSVPLQWAVKIKR
jgi:DsbC/DsbD-like thiol-disulfide interchange protein